MDKRDYEKDIFGLLFKASNSLQVYLDHLLKKDHLTAKQMFLMIVINTFGQSYPTLKDVADRSGSSYQNVKQLALKLQKQGYLQIFQDDIDKRKKLLKLTEQAEAFWAEREADDINEIDQLFQGFDFEELKFFSSFINKLQANIESMEERRII